MPYAHMPKLLSHTLPCGLHVLRYNKLNIRNAKSRALARLFDLKRSLVMSYSHMGTPTLPSALLRFTSEFGMDSGGTTVLLSPDKNL